MTHDEPRGAPPSPWARGPQALPESQLPPTTVSAALRPTWVAVVTLGSPIPPQRTSRPAPQVPQALAKAGGTGMHSQPAWHLPEGWPPHRARPGFPCTCWTPAHLHCNSRVLRGELALRPHCPGHGKTSASAVSPVMVKGTEVASSWNLMQVGARDTWVSVGNLSASRS